MEFSSTAEITGNAYPVCLKSFSSTGHMTGNTRPVCKKNISRFQPCWNNNICHVFSFRIEKSDPRAPALPGNEACRVTGYAACPRVGFFYPEREHMTDIFSSIPLITFFVEKIDKKARFCTFHQKARAMMFTDVMTRSNLYSLHTSRSSFSITSFKGYFVWFFKVYFC